MKVPRVKKPVKDDPKPRRNWSATEIDAVLNYLLNIIRSGKAIEKPNASTFYQALLKSVPLEDCSISQVKNQVGNLKRKYMSTVEWRNQTGQGVLEENGEEYFKGVLAKRCPHYDILHEIYGERLNIHPPFVYDSSVPSNPSIEIQLEHTSQFQVQEESEITSDHYVPPEETDAVDNSESIFPKSPQEKAHKRGKNPKETSGSKALTDLCKSRYDIHSEELQFKKTKWESEKLLAERQCDLEWQKFLVSKEENAKKWNWEEQQAKNHLEVSKTENDKKWNWKEQKAKDRLELEKYRIDKEIKLKLEIAKMQYQAGRETE